MLVPMTPFNAQSLALALVARQASRPCGTQRLDDDGPAPAPKPRQGSAFTGEFLVFALGAMRPVDLLQIQLPEEPCAPGSAPGSAPANETHAPQAAPPPCAPAAEPPHPVKASTLKKQARAALSPAAREAQAAADKASREAAMQASLQATSAPAPKAAAGQPVRLSEQLAHLQAGTPMERDVWAKLRGAEKAAEKDAKRLARGAQPVQPTLAPAEAPRPAEANFGAATPADAQPTETACAVPAELTALAQARAKVALFASLGSDTAGATVMSGPLGAAAEQALAGLLAAGTTSGPVVNQLRAIRRRCEDVAAGQQGTTADLFGAQLKGMLDELEALRGTGNKRERQAIDAVVEGIFRGACQGVEFGKPPAAAVPAAPPTPVQMANARPDLVTAALPPVAVNSGLDLSGIWDTMKGVGAEAGRRAISSLTQLTNGLSDGLGAIGRGIGASISAIFNG